MAAVTNLERKDTFEEEKKQLVVKRELMRGDEVLRRYKGVFGNDGTKKIEVESPNRGKFSAEFAEGKIRIWLSHHPTLLFVKEGEKVDVILNLTSPNNVRKLSGELGGVIKNEFGNVGPYYTTAKELRGSGETEGVVKGVGFRVGKEPKIFIKIEKGEIAEFGLVEHREKFAFVPSKDGGLRHPAILVRHNAVAKLRDGEVGVVVGLAHKNVVAEYIPKAEAVLKELSEIPQVAEYVRKSSIPRTLA